MGYAIKIEYVQTNRMIIMRYVGIVYPKAKNLNESTTKMQNRNGSLTYSQPLPKSRTVRAPLGGHMKSALFWIFLIWTEERILVW